MRPLPKLLIAFALVLSWGAGHAAACDTRPGDSKLAPALIGAWKEEGGDRLLNLEADRIILSLDGELAVRGLIRQDGGCLVLRRMGIQETWTSSLSGGLLKLKPEDSKAKEKAEEIAGTYRRLDQVPDEVLLEPLPVAASKSLPPERIQFIRNDITARFREEQVLLKSPEKPVEKIRQKIKVNRAYLRQLLGEIGWIDSPRFGAQTSVYAVILAKHTRDLRLMMTILPYAERDLKTPQEGQTYAVLYDALQLDLGHKQLYGTQIAEDDKGPFVLPMEESRDQVNRRLENLGLPSLDEYLSVARQAYAGREVQIRQDG